MNIHDNRLEENDLDSLDKEISLRAQKTRKLSFIISTVTLTASIIGGLGMILLIFYSNKINNDIATKKQEIKSLERESFVVSEDLEDAKNTVDETLNKLSDYQESINEGNIKESQEKAEKIREDLEEVRKDISRSSSSISKKGLTSNLESLKNLLSAKNIKQADIETDRIFSLVGPENINCQDLKVIDQLWQKYSNGKFGFQPQHDIWILENKNTNNFRERVGWTVGKRRLNHEELTFDFGAPEGHLPWVQTVLHENFLPKLDSCF